MLRFEVTRLVGAEAAALLEALPFGVREITEITRTGGPECVRASYKVRLDDGRTIKARRVRARESSPSAWDLAQALDDERLAPVIARSGLAQIETWIEGTPLDEHSGSDGFFEEAADVLAGLHGTGEILGERLLGLRSTAPALEEAERDLAKLLSPGALEADEIAQLLELAHEAAPEKAVIGLTHNDFCGENLVVDDAGRLRIVDNEALAIGFLDFDLGRTWYRWGLTPARWERFATRYQMGRADTPSKAALLFWRIAATARGARVRVVNLRSPRAEYPLSRLRELLRSELPHG